MARTSYSAISSYSRVEILHLLHESPGRTIQELCAHTGLHANTVREHLQRLADGGYVVAETERRTTRGRPRRLYSAATGTAAASSPIARRKALDAARRGDLLRRVLPAADPSPLEAEAVHQLDALVEDLEGAGFEPLVDERALTVDLTPCAHAHIDAHQRAILCTVHVEIMQGVLAEAHGPLHVEGLAPSCDPETCVVLLSRQP